MPAIARLFVLLVLTIALVGCGASTTKTVTKTTTVTASTSVAAATTAAPARPQNCSNLEASAVPSGTRCSSDGVKETIEHEPNAVHLATLTARIAGVSTAATLSGVANSATALGRFVVITLAITNDADSPESFDAIGTEQTALVGHGQKSYSEDFQAENGPDPRSCVSAADAPIQPGETASCDVVYDMPQAAILQARKDELGLLVANFGNSLGPDSTSVPTALGVIFISPLGSA